MCPRAQKTHWNVEKLRQPEILNQYQWIENWMKIKRISENETVDKKRNQIEKNIEKTATEAVEEKKRVRNEEWFYDECRARIDKKNTDRLSMIQKETRQLWKI